jgi:predicted phage tail component-like protein
MTYGFTFSGKHSREFAVVALSVDRMILPPKRIMEYEIPMRDGTIEYTDYTYAKRKISISVSIIAKTLEQLRERAREVAKWLSGNGLLIFDDEPDKAYSAKVTEGISIAQIVKCGECPVSFDCQPFAEAIDYDRITATVTQNGQEIGLTNAGTQKTPCRIIITNTGPGDISDIILTRLSVG